MEEGFLSHFSVIFLVRKGLLRDTQKYKVFFWLLFDFANTSFSVMMVTFAFPLYFKNVICNGEPSGDALWGFSVSLSMLLVAVISPVLGAAADYSGKRKRFLFFFTLISVVATALLSFSGPGMAVAAIILFILANMGFEGGLVFYDAYLKELATDKSVGRVSGYGFAMGVSGCALHFTACETAVEQRNCPCKYVECAVKFFDCSYFFCTLFCTFFSCAAG